MAYKCVSLARLRSCTRVHSRRLASQSRISACNLASLDSAAAATREVRRKRDIWDFRDARNIAFFVYYMVIFFIGCHSSGGIFCMGSFPRSYAYGKIRVRLMRTEGNGNENEGHFVSVGARVATLPRGWGGGVYVACFITAMWQKLLSCVVRFASALVLMSVAALLLVAGMGGLFLLFFFVCLRLRPFYVCDKL